MWLKCNFPSGCRIKMTIRRYGVHVDHQFLPMDSPVMVGVEGNVIRGWIKENNTSSYGDLLNKLEDICNTCKSGKQLIAKMKNHE